MGMVNTEITIKNYFDNLCVREGHLKPEEVRSQTVTAVADTGSLHLVITEELCEKLGLKILGEREILIANGQYVNCKIADGVEVLWKNRFTVVQAMVIPGAKKVLFGAVPMECMDLMVNPVSQEVVGAHGDRMETFALSYEF